MLHNKYIELLMGEFAGKLYNYKKLVDVVDSLLKSRLIDQSLAEFYKSLKNYNSDNFLVYFDAETKSLFGLEINSKNYYPELRIYKPDNENRVEIREICNKAYQLMPGLTISVSEENLPFKQKVVA